MVELVTQGCARLEQTSKGIRIKECTCGVGVRNSNATIFTKYF